MISREILDISIAISLLKRSYNRYSCTEQRLIDIYCNSQALRLAKGFCAGVKNLFLHSFLGRVTEIKQASPGVLDGSRVLQYLINLNKRWRNKIIRYSGRSLATCAAKDIKTGLYLSPAKIISIIVLTAITVNVVLAFILHKQIGSYGWLMRGLFLFAGIAGLFCEAGLKNIKSSSLFLKWVNPDKQSCEEEK